jgi:adenylosuccinate lyase
MTTPLSALSPLDGRYAGAVEPLRSSFSEEALMRARVEVEVRYFLALADEPGVKELPKLSAKQAASLIAIVDDFDEAEAEAIKKHESVTRHDVKAVEYYLQEKMKRIGGLEKHLPFIHFALTSEDTNNLAYGLLIHRALKAVVLPTLRDVVRDLGKLATAGKTVRMLSLTHGQPATPTTVGKEFRVYLLRLERQLNQLKNFRMQGKLGGAVGNFSAHAAAYPRVKWARFRDAFVRRLGMDPLEESTQINPHDDLAELSHAMFRINTILLDLSRDMWLYISRGVFRQRVIAGEVGSSTMPHKVNPIDFENAEGNIGLSNALFAHFAEKLPVSRLQRDLSDSTVQRNIGVAFGYHLLSAVSLRRGLGKVTMDRARIAEELKQNPEVTAEAIQTVLRKNGIADAYERLKELTRGSKLRSEDFRAYINTLALSTEEKDLLRGLLP